MKAYWQPNRTFPFLLAGAFLAAIAVAAESSDRAGEINKAFSLEFNSELILDYGDVRITHADVDAFLKRVPEDRRASVLADFDRIGQLLDNIYLTDAFLPLADSARLLEDPSTQARLYRALMLEVRNVYREHFIESVQLEDYSDSARELFLSRPGEFKGPELVDFEHILLRVPSADDEVRVMSQIISLYERASDGADFTELAARYSEDPSAVDNSGFFENIGRRDLVSQVSSVLESASVGTVQPPVRSVFGWHLVKLTGRHAPNSLTWEEARPQALELARQQHIDSAYERLLRDLQAADFEFVDGAIEKLLIRYGLRLNEPESSIEEYFRQQ